ERDAHRMEGVEHQQAETESEGALANRFRSSRGKAASFRERRIDTPGKPFEQQAANHEYHRKAQNFANGDGAVDRDLPAVHDLAFLDEIEFGVPDGEPGVVSPVEQGRAAV